MLIPVMAGFAWSWTDARSWYGVVASVHAWIELPLLLVALAVLPDQDSSNPAANDEALATAESANPRRAPKPNSVA